MSGFSGAVKLGDLDDFINPSQSCVVALNGDKLDLGAAELAVPEGGEVFLKKRGGNAASSQIPPGPMPIVPGAPLPAKFGESVKVSLSDCLACSGCVTSAETVLLQAQSAEAFKAALREAAGDGVAQIAQINATTQNNPSKNRKIKAVVVSVSPQSRASLARVGNLPLVEAAQRITGFFKSIGVAKVFDTTSARDISLLETAHEFCERFVAAKKQNSRNSGNDASVSNHFSSNTCVLPVLSSACPGWVCYAEKTQPEILKHVSSVKSPQAMMGAIVKRTVAAALGLHPAEIFHATVMPCFDKKLEASRGEFRIENTPETDCVLTTGEVAELIQETLEFRTGVISQELSDANARQRSGASALSRAPRGELDGWLASSSSSYDPSVTQNCSNASDAMDSEAMDADDTIPTTRHTNLYTTSVPGGGGGSGGYCDFVFRRAALVLFGVEVTGPLQYKTPRSKNPDLKELTLEVDGVVVLRFALAYGFRNIQNVVRKCKQGSSASGNQSVISGNTTQYDFVEIMACPSGCLNGGGQLPPPPRYEPGFRLSSKNPLPTTLGGQTAKELVDELEELYHSGVFVGTSVTGEEKEKGEENAKAESFIRRPPSANSDVDTLYKTFVGGPVGSTHAKRAWHTVYHDRSAEAAVAAGGTAAAAANLKISSDW